MADEQLPAIGQLTELRYLQLGLNKGIRGRTLNSFAQLTKLEDISLWDTSLDDAGFRSLPSFPVLKILAIGRTAVTDVSIARIVDFKALETLNVAYTNVTDNGIRQLASHPSIIRIDAAGSKISKATLNELTKLRPGLTTDLP